jgi:hypothetical protein
MNNQFGNQFGSSSAVRNPVRQFGNWGPQGGITACRTGAQHRQQFGNFQSGGSAFVRSARTAPSGLFEEAKGAYLARSSGRTRKETKRGLA